MTLSEKQIKELKKQLSEQIQNLPEEQRNEAQKQIDEMSNEAIEAMLKQQSSPNNATQSQQSVFRAIVSGELPSRIIDQNKNAIAVLDTKPISQGHTIIIPKNPVNKAKELPNSAFTLAKKIARRVSSKLKSESSEIQTQYSFGEIIINVIPIYDKPLGLNSPRQDVKEEDLDKIYKKLRVVKKPKVIRLGKTKTSSKIIKLNRRIP